VSSWLPTERVRLATARQSWRSLTFLHLRYEPAVVQRLLPSTLRVETFRGSAWVGITPFLLRASLLPFAPGPRASFVEVNVRTYVRTIEGTDAIWFFSLDLDQPVVVAALRAGLALPYRWSSTAIAERDGRVRYRVRRRVPPHRAASLDLTVDVGPVVREAGAFETFLVGRWRAVSVRGRRRTLIPVEHEPWPLHRAELASLRDDGFLRSVGLPRPSAAPQLLYSPGVEARLGWPSSGHRQRRGARTRSAQSPLARRVRRSAGWPSDPEDR
jgi:uncharacterized protein